MRKWRPALLALILGSAISAADVHVAVAANFTAPMRDIAAGFEKATGHRLIISYGAVGKFFAQIHQGAPFEVLISADEETPRRLEKAGLAIPASRFTYAVGRLVLWSPQPGTVDDQGQVLHTGSFKRLAIANPKMAVYGAAAIETMKHMGVLQKLESRLVYGENISQAYQFTYTGNTELGFVALSQIYSQGKPIPGSHWLVPLSLHPALRQDAILLQRGAGNPAASQLMSYLRSPSAKAVIQAYGYQF